MRAQQAARGALGGAVRAGLPAVVGLALMQGCGTEAAKPPEPATAVTTKAVSKAAAPKAKRGQPVLQPDMTVRERRALRKAGKLKE